MADRRASGIPSQQSGHVQNQNQIPPAPPLPPPSKASYFSRFVTQPLTTAYGSGSRPPSATSRPDGGRPNPLVPRAPGIRTVGSSQDASHKTGLDISALDINRDGTHAILAGKEILKTVRVHDARVVEEINLRAAVINYAERNAGSSQVRQRDGFGIHDVKWSHGQYSTHIATAAANGKVILYDLNRAGVELARLHEHTRQVHKLAFNPHQGYLLLSASQDATVRLWDLRDMRRDAMTCQSRDVYRGVSTPIRDVQWSPTDGLEFAFGTDSGTIQRWDFRQTKSPKQKITAHDQKTCTSIDWHPDGKHLLSSSVDKTVRVWDFSTEERRQKAVYVLTTPYPVHKARWRPPYWSNDHYEKGAYQCTQLATFYDRDHAAIHVWDFRRPYLPFREINRFASAPSDMLWHSRDTLWTVGREGIFQQNDIHLAPKVLDRRSLQAFAVSPSGELGGFAQKRPRRRRAGPDYSSDDTYLDDRRGKRNSPEKNSLRSSADDSLDDSFLSSSLRRHHGRTSSNRSARSFGSTPPSEVAPKVMFLTDSMAIHSESVGPNQVAVRGTLPGATSVQVFSYLAQKYKAIPLPDPPTLQSFHDLQQVFQQNADYAQRAAFYRLAETWRIIGVSITIATKGRAATQKKRRLGHKDATTVVSSQTGNTVANDKRLTPLQNPAVRAVLGAVDRSQPISASQSPNHAHINMESTSNLATPLARPLTTSSSVATDAQALRSLPDPDHEEAINLPPAVAGPHSSEAKSFLTPNNVRQSLSSPQWFHTSNDLDERRALIGSWRAPPRPPLSLEPPHSHGINIQIPPRLDRHDSDESFAMFSASTDSQRGTSMPSSFASGKSQSDNASIGKWRHDRTGSSAGHARPVDSGSRVSQYASNTNGLGQGSSISPTNIAVRKSPPAILPYKEADIQVGSARNGTEHFLEWSSREKAINDIDNLRKTNQLLRHDSSESDAYTSSRDELSAHSMDYSGDMEASGTIVPDIHDDGKYSQGVKASALLQHATESAPPALDLAAEESLLLSDFQAMHVDAEEGSTFAVIGLLKSVLAYHTGVMSDAQTSSLLLLLLAPLLPQTQHEVGNDNNDSAGILSHFSETFLSLGLSQTQAELILSTQLSPVLGAGINPFQTEAILSTYHAQLHSLSLFNAAATLRRLSYPIYPAVYEQALKDTQLGLLCLSCKSPINNPRDKMRCETCRRAQAPCPICWGRYPAFEPVSSKKKAKAKLRSSLRDKDHKRKRSSLLSNPVVDLQIEDEGASPSRPEKGNPPKATLWTWCPLCGHGGHTNCLSTWFADPNLSDGACATEGCLCDCVPGKRREQKLEELARKKAEKDLNKLVRRGDDWKVGESQAVSAVRGAISDSSASNRNSIQSVTVPGSGVAASGPKKDKGQRVRVVAP
ncbi:hypothetical protein BDV96DRAFT_500476 [Lophiotrema nucula]|uniref:Uncharacterized protein n=1 Tax=Lophiotrema nucula TaxID=690887 RepID=A0A6A5YVB9_9PLEO|nr:hypothetical protein BDV96DRAFT_500476 [Lophiotrema nucula]